MAIYSNSTDIIESSYDEDNGMYDVVQGQKSPKIVHQESGLHSEPVKGTKPKHPHSDYESDVSVHLHSVCLHLCMPGGREGDLNPYCFFNIG